MCWGLAWQGPELVEVVIMTVGYCASIFIAGYLTGLGLELALSLFGSSIYKTLRELERS